MSARRSTRHKAWFEAWLSGMTQKEIAEKHGVTADAVYQASSRNKWREKKIEIERALKRKQISEQEKIVQIRTLMKLKKASTRTPSLSKVYFIKAGEFIKIGTTNRPLVERLRALQGCNPNRLEVVGLMLGDCVTERTIHARFPDARHSGEWFIPTTDLLAFIDTLAARNVDQLLAFEDALYSSDEATEEVA